MKEDLSSTNSSPKPPEDPDDYEDENDFNFSDLKNKKTVKLGKYDPEYKHLTVSAGLNLKGKCSNKNCKANTQSQRSWIRKGFGVFDLGEARFYNKCQACNSPINGKTITSLGFTKAKVRIKGIRF